MSCWPSPGKPVWPDRGPELRLSPLRPYRGPVKTEEDPLDPKPPHPESMAAMAHTDEAVTGAGGIALRYGSFYGDPEDASLLNAVRARKFPVVGDGGGLWSHIHLEDAASATALALEHEGPAVYNIVDGEPAPTRVWLPELAKILGAPPPLHFPKFAARILAGEAVVVLSTESRGASNAKAKAELGRTLPYPSWRQGFLEASFLPILLLQRVDAEALAADAVARGWGDEVARHRRLIERIDAAIAKANAG